MIDRLTGLKNRSSTVAEYIATLPEFNGNRELETLKARMDSCASWLVIHDYYEIDQRRLVGAHTCQKHLLCPFCAVGRGARYMSKATPKLEHVVKHHPHLKPVLITLTVKNQHELQPVASHCLKSLRRLIQRRRDGLKGTVQTETAKIAGALYSVETTHSEDTGWHPHVHLLAFLDDWIDQEKLSEEWEGITGDSYIVDVRRVKQHDTLGNPLTLLDALSEVAKYAVKLSGLPEQRAWEAYRVFSRKRLMGSLGVLRGIQMDDQVTEDPIADQPYVELLYRWTGRKYQLDTDNIKTRPQGRPAPPDPACQGTAEPDPSTEITQGTSRKAAPHSPDTSRSLHAPVRSPDRIHSVHTKFQNRALQPPLPFCDSHQHLIPRPLGKIP